MLSNMLWTLTILVLRALASPVAAVGDSTPTGFEASTVGLVTLDDSGNIIAHEIFSSLGKRNIAAAQDVPPTCTFGNIRTNQYYYRHYDLSATGKSGDACIGWKNADCPNPWGALAQSYIKQSINQQITKDGQFKSTTVGNWLAGFDDFTTAFDDRDPRVFSGMFKLNFMSPEYQFRKSTTYVSLISGSYLGFSLSNILASVVRQRRWKWSKRRFYYSQHK